MTFDRSEFEELKKKTEAQRIEALLPQLMMLKQGAVLAENLTGMPAWDLFLRYLQGAIEETERQRDQLQNVLNSPHLVNTEEMMRAKIEIVRCNERIRAWKAVISLPADLINLGEKAADLLTRMEKDDADDRGTGAED